MTLNVTLTDICDLDFNIRVEFIESTIDNEYIAVIQDKIPDSCEHVCEDIRNAFYNANPDYTVSAIYASPEDRMYFNKFKDKVV